MHHRSIYSGFNAGLAFCATRWLNAPLRVLFARSLPQRAPLHHGNLIFSKPSLVQHPVPGMDEALPDPMIAQRGVLPVASSEIVG